MFGRFEATEPNELWVGDALHGPRVGDRKTYLFAFLDDHSRLAVGYRFGFAEDAVRLAAALRPALASRGVPAGIYVDNGSAFCDAWLLRACAKLGVRLVHSAPGRPQGGQDRTVVSQRAHPVLIEVADTTSEDLAAAASITPPRCWSLTGCLWRGWKPNTIAAPIPRPGRPRWRGGSSWDRLATPGDADR
ncbi:hypothetical protein MAGR_15700 [Mycolicibacterium agri]|uniref:Integrase catalytic domain-containing protein n=1 Tax=Mycolicibacterium agri TaxID=36811 RepID=A0A7I9VY53_MYCAG|nr:transposase family protein [Mycolicibacterium agri]GFG50129.1 hypothetical protein MAGR_15700 [Mycolicibacterium agri]